MSTTIFCTFDQQDMADLAMGDLRSAVAGIKSIHYINGYSAKENSFTSGMSGTAGMAGMAGIAGTAGMAGTAGTAGATGTPGMAGAWIGLFPLKSAMHYGPPSRPVNVKIVCADAAVKDVKSRLVNLRAYQIITMR